MDGDMAAVLTKVLSQGFLATLSHKTRHFFKVLAMGGSTSLDIPRPSYTVVHPRYLLWGGRGRRHAKKHTSPDVDPPMVSTSTIGVQMDLLPSPPPPPLASKWVPRYLPQAIGTELPLYKSQGSKYMLFWV